MVQYDASMGAAAGGGDLSPLSKVWGTSPRNRDFYFLELIKKNYIFRILKIKWPKSEETSELGVGGFGGPQWAPSQNFLAALLDASYID